MILLDDAAVVGVSAFSTTLRTKNAQETAELVLGMSQKLSKELAKGTVLPGPHHATDKTGGVRLLT